MTDMPRGRAAPTAPTPSLPLVILLAILASFLGGCTSGGEPGGGGGPGTGPPPELPDVPGDWRLLPSVTAVDEAVRVGSAWVLLDGAQGLLHRVDGDDVSTAGGRGDGPGELQAPRLLVPWGDGFAVLAVDGRLDRFDASARPRGRVRLTLDACPLPQVTAAAAPAGRPHLTAICAVDRTRRILVVALDEDGRGRTLAGRPAPDGPALSLHGPGLAAVGDRLAFGDGAGRCVALLEVERGAPTEERCFRTGPFPVPETIRRELEVGIGRRARAAGIAVALPGHLPWHDRLLAGRDGELLARRPVDAVSWRLERVGGSGGWWPLPPGVTVHGGGGRLLLVHHSLEGVHIREVEAEAVPWRDIQEESGGAAHPRGPVGP